MERMICADDAAGIASIASMKNSERTEGLIRTVSFAGSSLVCPLLAIVGCVDEGRASVGIVDVFGGEKLFTTAHTVREADWR